MHKFFRWVVNQAPSILNYSKYPLISYLDVRLRKSYNRWPQVPKFKISVDFFSLYEHNNVISFDKIGHNLPCLNVLDVSFLVEQNAGKLNYTHSMYTAFSKRPY